MLSENALFKALSVKDILTASDGTRKVALVSHNYILMEIAFSRYGRFFFFLLFIL